MADSSGSSAPPARLFDGFFWIAPSGAVTGAEGGFAKTETHWTYPNDVTAITKAFTNLTQFCFPDLEKARMETPGTAHCRNEFFTFTLTEGDGNRVYGVCMRALFRGESHRFDVKRRPRHCLCIITRHPFFSLLRTILQHVHALALLEDDAASSSSSKPKSRTPPASAVQFLAQVYAQVMPETIGSEDKAPSAAAATGAAPSSSSAAAASLAATTSSIISMSKLQVRRTSIPTLARDFTIHLPKVSGHGASVPILPLLEVLGVDKFMQLLSAALCERRLIFVADDVGKLSSAVLATASMLQPFDWQHVFIPLLPSNMFDYVAAPMPYVIGIRRYLLPKLEKVALDDVVLVDVDAGTLRVHGNRALIKDFVGASGSLQKQATEDIDMLLKTGTEWYNYITGRGTDIGVDNGPRDIIFAVLSDLRGMLASKPSKASLRNVATGITNTLSGSAKGDEESKVLWALRSEKVLRDSLTLFFVYLFADMEEAMLNSLVLPPSSVAATVAASSASAGASAKSDSTAAFGHGDSRAAFDLAGFLARRAALGDSPELQGFLAEFRHSQMFERFCDVKFKALRSSVSSMTGEIKAPITAEVAMRRRRASSGSAAAAAAVAAAGGEVDVFEIVCRELRRTQRAPTIANIKSIIGAKSSTKNVVDLHAATLHFTDGGASKGTLSEGGNSEVARMQVQQAVERICADANNSDQFVKIMRTVALRLESCRASGARGHSGFMGLRALKLLRALLVSGPQCALSYALDFVPVLRQLINPIRKKSILGDALRDAVQMGGAPVDVKTPAGKVLALLLDHQMLQHQRRYAALVKDQRIPHLVSTSQRVRNPPILDFAKMHALLEPLGASAKFSRVELTLTTPVMRLTLDDDEDEDQDDAGGSGKKSKKSPVGLASTAVTPLLSSPSPSIKSKKTPAAKKTTKKSASAPASNSSVSAEEAKERMEKVYARYNPSKMAEIPTLLEKYKGREADIVQALVGKYYKNHMESIFMEHNPSKVIEIPALLEKYKGREESIIEAMEKKYLQGALAQQ